MPDIWMDVDATLNEVPVNILPFADDTDYKSEENPAYNAAGMDLIWIFVTTAGVLTQTPVTPTTGGGDYDWACSNGMASIGIPASGGASVNNNAEGFGRFIGRCDGVLPWRGPVIGFRDASLNDKLVDSAYDTNRGLAGLALPGAAAGAAGGLPFSAGGSLDLDTLLGYLDATISSRLAASGYTAPDNTGIGNIYDIVSHATYGNSAIQALVAALNNLSSSDVQTATDAAITANAVIIAINNYVDELETRLTAVRAGYMDNLNVGGNVASQADIQGITQAQRVRIAIPASMERPDSGSSAYRIWIYSYNEQHQAEDLDSNPTVTAENNEGIDRSSNLGTVQKLGATTGIYYVDYTVSDSHLIEGLVFKVNATEDAVTTQYPAASIVVDTTAVDFTSSDRNNLEAVKAITDQFGFTGSNVNAQVKAKDNIDFGALEKASLNAATPQDSAGVATLLTRIIGTLVAGNHQPQSGDSYTIVSDVDSGNAALRVLVDAIKAITDHITFTTANKVDVRVDAVGSNAVTSPDDFKASVSALGTLANQVSILSQLTLIKAKTDNLPSGVKKGVALNNFEIFMVQSADHFSGATGLVPGLVGYIAKDGGSFVPLTGTLSEKGYGVYTIDTINATEMDADIITLRFVGSGADDRIIVIKTVA